MASAEGYKHSEECVSSDQVVSALAGGALLGAGIARGGFIGGILALAGAPFLARGFGGCTGIKDTLRDKATTIREIASDSASRYPEGNDDIVTEASMESFPASDPPAW